MTNPSPIAQLKDQVICLTGHLRRISREDLVERLAASEAQLVEQLDLDASLLIAGDDPGPQVAEALHDQIPIMSEGELLRVLDGFPFTPIGSLLPHSQNLAACQILEDGELALPVPDGIEESLTLRWRRVNFVSQRKFGEGWGLALTERDAFYVGYFALDNQLLPCTRGGERFHYSRLMSDGSEYVSEEKAFNGSDGLNVSWLMEAAKEGNLSWVHAPHREGAHDERYALTLEQSWRFACVEATETERLVVDFIAELVSWEHGFVARDLDM